MQHNHCSGIFCPQIPFTLGYRMEPTKARQWRTLTRHCPVLTQLMGALAQPGSTVEVRRFKSNSQEYILICRHHKTDEILYAAHMFNSEATDLQIMSGQL